jgi:CxxC motif-containing protein (DUF1111 family)
MKVFMNTKRWLSASLSLVLYIGIVGLTTFCKQTSQLADYEAHEELSAGECTTVDSSLRAFDRPAPNLSEKNFTRFQVGNSFFRSAWVTAPASTSARDGLGPLFNANSCTGCHIRDGRGTPPSKYGEPLSSMLIRLSIDGKTPEGAPLPEPIYGGQLQNRAIRGVQPEGDVKIKYEEIEEKFEDGESYTLRKPIYEFTNLKYGNISPHVRLSPRTAPFMIGLGLLEAIPAEAILANADPSDKNKDDISGRANYVWDYEKKKTALGRFGWKANQPNLKQQVAGAFNGDIGLTTSIFTNDHCTNGQGECSKQASGGNPEISDEILSATVSYSSSLAVPRRRNANQQEVLRGKKLFLEAQCSACHAPKFITKATNDYPEYQNITIRPYTDLLLHDLGEGLADDRTDFEATGKEWRTAPLWGIGLVGKINGHTNFLHDGRAHNLTEAILWHGGEAEKSKNLFKKMPKQDRNALVKFLESL